MAVSERFGFILSAVMLLSPFARAQGPATELVAGNFVEVTAAAGVQFLHQAPHTSKKYLIETMGSGTALFDYDNDVLLDIFLVNGAPFTDPHPRERFHKRPVRKTGTVFITRKQTEPLKMSR